MSNRNTAIFGVFGTAPDTGNLGVSALCHGAVSGILRVIPQADVIVFDHGRGLRPSTIEFEGKEHPFQLCGAVNSRRFYRPECLWNIRLQARLGRKSNPAAKVLAEATAILDVTAGDSFTDLYGQRAFEGALLRKTMALENNRPLILLPQTYGPFRSKSNEQRAAEVVKRCSMAWARDLRSFEILKELLGSDFDESIHHAGVDLAFGLETKKPKEGLTLEFQEWSARADGKPLIGLNVSGLIYNQPEVARSHYGFKIDYRRTLETFINRFLDETGGQVCLVPHVLTEAFPESDCKAAEELRLILPQQHADSIFVLPPVYSHEEIRWFISKMDWFCGTRMHSTIASICAGTPTTTICYSDKAQGVFDSCDLSDAVIDPRVLDEKTVLTELWRTWTDRSSAKEKIDRVTADVRKRARDQMRLIGEFATTGSMSSDIQKKVSNSSPHL